VLAAAVACGLGWYHAAQVTSAICARADDHLIDDQLQLIATIWNDNVTLLKELEVQPYAEPAIGVLNAVSCLRTTR
jgi:hypothetical protein